MAVEDLKEARHATHLLLNVFLQVILLLHYPRRHVLISRKIRTSLFFLLLSKIFSLSKQLRNSQRASSCLYICESERERKRKRAWGFNSDSRFSGHFKGGVGG